VLPIRSAFSSFSTDNIKKSRHFYGEKLGLEVRDSVMGMLEVVLGADQFVTIYPKPNHEPATFTVLNFIVPHIEEAVDDLKKMGVHMEHYPKSDQMQQDEKGIARDPQGPAIAWFKDNAGNTLSIIEDASQE